MNNPWKRKGLSYKCTVYLYRGNAAWAVTKKISFITYYLIKWIHGESKLIDMAWKFSHKELFE